MWLGAALILTAASAALVATQGLDDAAAAPTDTQKSNTPKMGHPYLDEFGNICQDKMEMMQHVEYEKQIMCKAREEIRMDIFSSYRKKIVLFFPGENERALPR